jgi:hypothetical protein
MIGHPRRNRRDPDDDRGSLRERLLSLARGWTLVAVAFTATALWILLMEASRVIWHRLCW